MHFNLIAEDSQEINLIICEMHVRPTIERTDHPSLISNIFLNYKLNLNWTVPIYELRTWRYSISAIGRPFMFLTRLKAKNTNYDLNDLLITFFLKSKWVHPCAGESPTIWICSYCHTDTYWSVGFLLRIIQKPFFVYVAKHELLTWIDYI